MANLEVAADELVRKLKSVDDDVAEAREGLARLTGQIASLGEALDEQWVEVAKAVGGLVEAAAEDLAALGEESEEATQSVATLESAGHAAEDAVQTDLESAEQGTASLTQAFEQRAPQMDGLAESGDQALAALEEQANEVAQALEQAMQQARDFLTGDVVGALDSMQSQLADRFEALRKTLTEECTALVQGAYEEWAERLEEVLSLVEEDGFLAMQVNGPAVVDWAMGELTHEYDEETKLLLQVSELVQRALEALRDEGLPRAAEEVGGDEGARALAQAIAETETALAGTAAALDACREVLARYSFVEI